MSQPANATSRYGRIGSGLAVPAAIGRFSKRVFTHPALIGKAGAELTNLYGEHMYVVIFIA